MRVRVCSPARAIENQCFVILSGNVGNIPGVAAETTPNTEMVALADLRYANLHTARNFGTVQNFKDRRFNL